MEAARLDLHLAEVADAAGMSRQALNQRLRGPTELKLSEILRLAKALEIPFSRLTEGVDGAVELEQRKLAT